MKYYQHFLPMMTMSEIVKSSCFQIVLLILMIDPKEEGSSWTAILEKCEISFSTCKLFQRFSPEKIILKTA